MTTKVTLNGKRLNFLFLADIKTIFRKKTYPVKIWKFTSHQLSEFLLTQYNCRSQRIISEDLVEIHYVTLTWGQTLVHLILLEEGKHKPERRRVTFSPYLDLFSGKEQIGRYDVLLIYQFVPFQRTGQGEVWLFHLTLTCSLERNKLVDKENII